MNTRLRLLLATVLLTAGCASPTADPNPSSTPSAERSTPVASPTSPAASPQGSPNDKGEITVTGVVEIVGIEGGCRALRTTGNQTYELKGGDTTILKTGARVTVRGKVRTDLMTICQIGPVLEVISSRPA